ncbi:response regulator transcription factor [Paenibacillus sp. MMS20-IR301]|uniref:response regulator transcription factor n=1 Tax=Paenibacillus sp. MMS20-IR301 TaxID=2895946 RepID=UPI0028E93D2D|nr:response regulator transcription factor [Paenibacillus sp. MMS20-IR301]WNS43160.1 response regulator transcription factor [Paenibacillus sp. MMS20-IR301]
MDKILIIEDDLKLQKYISEYLEAYHFEVETVKDFSRIVAQAEESRPQLILLDINLPVLDGFYYLKVLRKSMQTPIIILSARSDESEQIRGMEYGADDYVTKPFKIGILLAKINAVLRRAYPQAEEPGHTAGSLKLLKDTMKLQIKEQMLELSKNEFRLLQMFMKRPGEILTREELLEALWDEQTFVDDNTLTVNITRLKKKLAGCGLHQAIITKRGVGYALDPANC